MYSVLNITRKAMYRSIFFAGSIVLATASLAHADETPLLGLVTKTDTNPFFAKMKEGASAKATEMGARLQSFAGKYEGDNETQVASVESLISAGAAAILISANDSLGIAPTIKKAKDAGILIIALDTPLDPPNLADGTFATDNFRAGELGGQWAAATLGTAAAEAKIAFLDASSFHPPVDVARDQGFMKGFGIDIKDPKQIGDEDDSRIVGHQYAKGSEEGGRTGAENLLQKQPDISVIYTLNEPTAAGAYQALKAFGKAEAGVLITSVDGGCEGVKNVQAGVIGATSMQFPLKMASMGVEAALAFVKSGTAPQTTEGLEFFDTGVTLVTDRPVDGIESITSEEALKQCWG